MIPSTFKTKMHEKLFKNRAISAYHYLDLDKNVVTVKICADDEMRSLNKTYRGIDQSTDVLSFNLDFTEPQSDKSYLGDIVISLPTAQIQADEHHQPLENEMIYLLIHGLLHLMGYDHQTVDQEQEMAALQEKIFNQVIEKEHE